MRDDQLDRGGGMSAPDARLSAAERAALAGLEAAASAADPQLASRLKGARRSHRNVAVPRVVPVLLRAWATFLGIGWWAVPLTLAGLVLAVLGLSAGLAVSVIGVLAAAAGLRVIAELLHRRLSEFS